MTVPVPVDVCTHGTSNRNAMDPAMPNSNIHASARAGRGTAMLARVLKCEIWSVRNGMSASSRSSADGLKFQGIARQQLFVVAQPEPVIEGEIFGPASEAYDCRSEIIEHS